MQTNLTTLIRLSYDDIMGVRIEEVIKNFDIRLYRLWRDVAISSR